MEVNLENEVLVLTDLIKFFEPSFVNYKYTKHLPYNHIGATITDLILQAGLNYRTVVYPRVYRILNDYNYYGTTSKFIELADCLSLNTVINWNNTEKIKRIESILELLKTENVETEDDLRDWIIYNDNIIKLLNIPGIGNKTVDYLKKLLGLPSVPIDRHLYKFLEIAGARIKNHRHANYLYCEASSILKMDQCELDYYIWNLMSSIYDSKYY